MSKPDEPDSHREALVRAVGAEEADVMLVSVDILLHGLAIGDWRRVYKGLWCVQETLRRISGHDLPDYIAPPRPREPNSE